MFFNLLEYNALLLLYDNKIYFCNMIGIFKILYNMLAVRKIGGEVYIYTYIHRQLDEIIINYYSTSLYFAKYAVVESHLTPYTNNFFLLLKSNSVLSLCFWFSWVTNVYNTQASVLCIKRLRMQFIFCLIIQRSS